MSKSRGRRHVIYSRHASYALCMSSHMTASHACSAQYCCLPPHWQDKCVDDECGGRDQRLALDPLVRLTVWFPCDQNPVVWLWTGLPGRVHATRAEAKAFGSARWAALDGDVYRVYHMLSGQQKYRTCTEWARRPLMYSENSRESPPSQGYRKDILFLFSVRIGEGYIPVPAYKGSLAEAKGACNQTKPNLYKCELKALS
eukprot:scaffold170505_cov17-Tisochrysis_lutea.AAC.4